MLEFIISRFVVNVTLEQSYKITYKAQRQVTIDKQISALTSTFETLFQLGTCESITV